jgi:hypothetical protein
MSTTADLTSLSKESEARGQAGAFGQPAQEAVSEQDGGFISRAFGGAPGEPPANGAIRILQNPSLSHSANGGVRAISLMRAQQTFGNRFAQRAVAQVRRRPAPARLLQRQCSCGGTCAACQAKVAEEEEPKLLQRQTTQLPAAGDLVDAAVVPSNSTGQPLDEATRNFMEPRFGTDFSDVRVHTGSAAAQSADALQADAYATGRDIYFAAGKYAPASQEGMHLIAHELAHVEQQENGALPAARSRAGSILIGDASDPLEAEAERAADTLVGVTGGAPSSTLAISQEAGPVVRRDLRSGAAAVWDATGGRVVGAAGELWDQAKETAASFVDRIAPGVLPLLRSAGTFLYEKITAGIDGVFGGIASRVEKQGVAGAITGILGEMAGSISKSVGQLAAGSCHAIVDAASSIITFVKELGGEAFAELGRIAGNVGDFFSAIWKDFAAPALDAIQKVAGQAWQWIKDKAQWLWDQLLPVRKVLGSAWDWIKKQFNIAKDGVTGLLDRFYDWAKEQWFKIREKIAPILGPLKMVAGALLLLSPLGPIIAIWKGAPLLWKGLQWIWANGIKPVTEKIRAEFREHILPYILDGIDGITAKLDQASAFLCGHASTISAGLRSAEGALASISFLQFASKAVGAVAGFFDTLAAKGKCKFSDVISAVKAALRRVFQFLKPVLELLRQMALVSLLGPWAILDDGVWKTLNDILAFARKTPCIREIAGLLHIDGAMAKVGEIRLVLKDTSQVLSNQEKFEAEIHKRLDGMLGMIPAEAQNVLGTIAGLDGPHLDTLLKRFLAPKLAEVVSKAPQLLLDMVWGLVWPWPGVIKDYEEIEKQVDKLKTSLWDFQFSKAADACLAIWRGVNGIVGLLYGWFFLAAVLIGSVFGAPEAGAAVAYEVGEVLLASTLLAEALSIDKAKLNLMSRARLAKPASEREAEDKEDYETISGSVINLAILGAMAILGEIAVSFVKAVFAEIKGIFLPEASKGPKVEVSETPKIEAPKLEQPKIESATSESPKSEISQEKASETTVPEGEVRSRVSESTPDGQHEIKVTEKGELVRCSAFCGKLRTQHEVTLRGRADLEAELALIERKAKSGDPQLEQQAAHDAAKLDQRLRSIDKISHYSNEQLDAAIRSHEKGTILGDDLRFARYKRDGGLLPYEEWYPASRGGRGGGPGHQAIQKTLFEDGPPGSRKEVQVGDRFADAYWPKGPNGKPVYHQIGELNPVRGDPIMRERLAIEDIRRIVGKEVEIWFWDKTQPGATAPALKNPDLMPSWVMP